MRLGLSNYGAACRPPASTRRVLTCDMPLAFTVKMKFEPSPRPSGRAGHPVFAGGHSDRATPVPIPNTAVKPVSAHGTARATLWESRTSPALNFAPRASKEARGVRFFSGNPPGGLRRGTPNAEARRAQRAQRKKGDSKPFPPAADCISGRDVGIPGVY